MLGVAGALLLVCVACVAVELEYVLINAKIDEATKLQNELLTMYHLGQISVPALVLPNVTLSNGVFVGLNSMMRTADCIMINTLDDNSTTIDFNYGLRLLAFAYGSIKANGTDFSGIVRVRDNNMRLTYTLSSSPSCNAKIHTLKITNLDRASLEASFSSETIDVSEFLDTTVRSTLNEILEKKKPIVEKALEKLICQQRMPVADHFPELFNSLSKMSLLQE